MSLEQTIADLVAASNSLTGTINSKMNEIDQKVDEATASVPNVLRDNADQNFYIDAVIGDDSNDGLSPQAPLKTFDAANGKSIGQFSTTFHLRRGQTHITNGIQTVFTSLVNFVPWGQEGSELTKLIFKLKLRELNGVPQAYGQLFGLRGGVARFQGLDITAMNESGAVVGDAFGLIGRLPGRHVIMLDGCNVKLQDSPFCQSYSGFSLNDFVLRGVVIEKINGIIGDGKFVNNIGSNPSIRMDINNLSFVNTDIQENFPLEADNSNVFSNSYF